MSLISYHGDASTKREVLKRLILLEKSNTILHRNGIWKNEKMSLGLHVLGNMNYQNLQTELGIPLALGHIYGEVFQRLEPESALTWPRDIFTAINPGKRLEKITWQLMAWLLTNPVHTKEIKHATVVYMAKETQSLLKTLLRGKHCDKDAAWELGRTDAGIHLVPDNNHQEPGKRIITDPRLIEKTTGEMIYHMTRYIACNEIARRNPENTNSNDKAAFFARQSIVYADYAYRLRASLDSGKPPTRYSDHISAIKNWLLENSRNV